MRCLDDAFGKASLFLGHKLIPHEWRIPDDGIESSIPVDQSPPEEAVMHNLGPEQVRRNGRPGALGGFRFLDLNTDNPTTLGESRLAAETANECTISRRRLQHHVLIGRTEQLRKTVNAEIDDEVWRVEPSTQLLITDF
jgi:hypothetical protein